MAIDLVRSKSAGAVHARRHQVVIVGCGFGGLFASFAAFYTYFRCKDDTHNSAILSSPAALGMACFLVRPVQSRAQPD